MDQNHKETAEEAAAAFMKPDSPPRTEQNNKQSAKESAEVFSRSAPPKETAKEAAAVFMKKETAKEAAAVFMRSAPPKETAKEAAAVFMNSARGYKKELTTEQKLLLVLGAGIILAVALWQLGSGLSPQGGGTVSDKQYSYDVIRLKNATNIMLALQDYNYVNNDFPKTLNDLKPVYLSSEVNLTDPEARTPYYYTRLSDVKFVLCIYVEKGGVVGVNIKECPTRGLQLE